MAPALDYHQQNRRETMKKIKNKIEQVLTGIKNKIGQIGTAAGNYQLAPVPLESKPMK
jgi:hypothetical protein